MFSTEATVWEVGPGLRGHSGHSSQSEQVAKPSRVWAAAQPLLGRNEEFSRVQEWRETGKGKLQSQIIQSSWSSVQFVLSYLLATNCSLDVVGRYLDSPDPPSTRKALPDPPPSNLATLRLVAETPSTIIPRTYKFRTLSHSNIKCTLIRSWLLSKEHLLSIFFKICLKIWPADVHSRDTLQHRFSPGLPLISLAVLCSSLALLNLLKAWVFDKPDREWRQWKTISLTVLEADGRKKGRVTGRSGVHLLPPISSSGEITSLVWAFLSQNQSTEKVQTGCLHRRCRRECPICASASCRLG